MCARKPSIAEGQSAVASVVRAGSENPDAALAAREIHEGLGAANASCIFFFCSSDYRLDLLSRELSDLFGSIRVIGCTTAGEITPLGCKRNSIAAFGLSGNHFAVETVLIKNLADFSAEDAGVLVNGMVQRLDLRAVSPLVGSSFALSLLDGMSIREELVLNALSIGLQDIPLVGGSAGDNLHFVDTQIYYDGEFHKNAAVLALVNTTCPFTVFSSHHLNPESEKLVVTSADPYERVVYEFNAEPAALEYCRINSLTIDDLSSEAFALHPLAVQFGEDLYVRSVQRVNEDLSLTFFCAIDVGVVLTQMTSTGLLKHAKALFSLLTEKIGQPELVVGYDCIHRRCEIDHYALGETMSDLYSKYNVIGFNTYGEQSGGIHLNHTISGVAIGFPSDEDQ